jgi:hypothetical protein
VSTARFFDTSTRHDFLPRATSAYPFFSPDSSPGTGQMNSSHCRYGSSSMEPRMSSYAGSILLAVDLLLR